MMLSTKISKNKKFRKTTPQKQPIATSVEIPEDIVQEKIFNEDIASLQITSEALAKLRHDECLQHDNVSKKMPPVRTFIVQRSKPISEDKRARAKLITVAKPAPPEAPIRPFETYAANIPSFDYRGNIKPFSLLGSVEDYEKEASKQTAGELRGLCDEESPRERLSVKYEKKRCSINGLKYPRFMSADESNALKHWQNRMLERRKQQDYLSNLLNKSVDRLVMNESDGYRQTQELRDVIERALQPIDRRKGGTEFWQLTTHVGNDYTGLRTTLTETQKGNPPPIEHVGIPDHVHQEKGTNWDHRPETPFRKPWHQMSFMKTRQEQLKPIIRDIDPYQPEVNYLEVIGSNTPYRTGTQFTEFPSSAGGRNELDKEIAGGECVDTNDLQARSPGSDLSDNIVTGADSVAGPSLLFGAQLAQWIGDSCSHTGQDGLEARVVFETVVGKRTVSTLEVLNNGTSSVYFDWKKLPYVRPFDLVNSNVQRFYFNSNSDVILPGNVARFPFVFKSPTPGVYMERWKFITHPVLCGGASLVVVLKGVAVLEDKYLKQRTQLEEDLARKQGERIVASLVEDLVEGVQTPERPRSPVDAYITEEEIFCRKNPKLIYSNEPVQALRRLYLSLFVSDEAQSVTSVPSKSTLATRVSLSSMHVKASKKEPAASPQGGVSAAHSPAASLQAPESHHADLSAPRRGSSRKEAPTPPTTLPPVISEEFPEATDANENKEEVVEWDLSVDTIRNAIREITNENADKENLLQELNDLVSRLSFPPFLSKQQRMYNAGHSILCDLVESIVSEAMSLRSSLGLPDTIADGAPESAPVEAEKLPKKSTKLQQRPRSKTPLKESPSRQTSGRKGVDKERALTEAATAATALQSTVVVDPLAEPKYKERLYNLAYNLIDDHLGKLSTVFDEIQLLEGGVDISALLAEDLNCLK